MSRIQIFDTTLRDGEQAPGNSMTAIEKLRFAHQLAKLKVDVIEAGFPVSSEGELESLRQIAREVQGPIICALARTDETDISVAIKSLKYCDRSRIHTFIATSSIHMQHKLRLQPNQVREAAARAVDMAKRHADEVEFSAEDATRSDRSFLLEVYQTAIDAGASILNIPDTVGFFDSTEYSDLVRFLVNNLNYGDEVIFSTHCHDDLGLAVANSYAGVLAGARQVECAVNGIGERAGNASLEEVVMLLRMKRESESHPAVETKFLFETSAMLAEITGNRVPPNKAIVGSNAFAHEAGIHQDGVIKEVTTYEIMDPDEVGNIRVMPIGKHSGKNGMGLYLQEMGFGPLLNDDQVKLISRLNKIYSDQNKSTPDVELARMVLQVYCDLDHPVETVDQALEIAVTYRDYYVPPLHFSDYHVDEQVGESFTITVAMVVNSEAKTATATKVGPIAALFSAIKQHTFLSRVNLGDYHVDQITDEGEASVGKVSVTFSHGEDVVQAIGTHTDSNKAAALAFTDAFNKLYLRLFIKDLQLNQSTCNGGLRTSATYKK